MYPEFEFFLCQPEEKIKIFMTNFQFSVFAFGVYSSRLHTAILAITLVLVQMKPICFVHRIKKYFVIAGFGLPAILVLVSCFYKSRFEPQTQQSN